VGGRPLAVQQPGRRERERARRDGREPDAPLMRGLKRGDDGSRRLGGGGPAVTRNEDRVGMVERIEPLSHVVRQPVTAGHRAGRGSTHEDLVRHGRPVGEHLSGNADVERLRTLQHQHHDLMIHVATMTLAAALGRVRGAADHPDELN
jgi:hypothetical protein